MSSDDEVERSETLDRFLDDYRLVHGDQLATLYEKGRQWWR
jgi:hypothetical protein